MLTGSQTTTTHATGIMHPEKNASVGIVAKGIHIREEKLPALLMENYVAGVGSKTTLKLYVDPKILTRETSPRIRNATFKTSLMRTPVQKNRMILPIHSLSTALVKSNHSLCSKSLFMTLQ